ncbi:MAG: response regulator [bacterium]|nr:response regulator [bacterium]
MPKKCKVLVVEDKERYQYGWADALGEKIEVLHAFTIEEGRRLFDANPDIDAVVMDACVPGNEPNSIPLVKYIRKSFKGPVIAASTEKIFRERLIEAGCNFESEKDRVPAIVNEVLALRFQI